MTCSDTWINSTNSLNYRPGTKFWSRPRNWVILGTFNEIVSMNILVNGKPREVAAGLTAEQLIQMLDLTEKRLAMEVNREILPRSEYGSHQFNAEDNVEIVAAIGGG
jgi:sulfur carrier protein